MPKRNLPVLAPAVMMDPVLSPAPPSLDDVVFKFEKHPHGSLFERVLEFLHRHSLVVFILLFLLVAASALRVGAAYWSARITLTQAAPATSLHIPAQPLHGPNLVVASTDLSDTLQRVAGQALNLTISDKAVPVSGDTIKSWLQIVADNKKGVTYIHVNEAAINKSLSEVAAPLIKAPVNQVTAANADGSNHILSAGKNGTQLGDITPITHQINQDLLGAKGMQLNLPVETLAFASVTPASFDKLIEVNVVSKQMWLYEKGQLVNTYPISAGAPATPTPIGQFKIYSKLAVQDMRGFNADGTKYFQPQVHWVNYFLPGGYAVHGNYWRPSSWFGAINSSHGCVSLPDTQAKDVYDWAVLGTTVITHY